MPVQAQSADGVIHEFPDGTDPGVVDKVMKSYVTSAAPAPQTPAPGQFDGLSLDDLKARYRQHRLIGSDPKLLSQIADAYVAKEGKQTGYLGSLDDAVRQVARGVPVVGGALDELSAGANALMGGDYTESLDYQRARDRAVERSNPALTTGLQVAGGVASGVGAANALGLGVGSAAPLMQRAIVGAAAGAPTMAADQFARGEGATDRTQKGALGAVLGGAVGAAAPVVGQAVGSGAQRLADYLTSDTALANLGLTRPAANVLLRQLGIDDTLTGTGAARIRAAGPDAMLADAGPAATNLLDTALQRSGPGSTAARNAIEQRATQANQQMRGTLDATMGPPVGVETQQAGIRAGTQPGRAAAYDAAYDSPIDYAGEHGRNIEQLLTRVPQEAINQANRLMRVGGHASRQIRATMNADGTVSFDTLPDVRQLDYVTRALNEVARGAEGQGAMGGTTAAGRAYGNLAGEIRQTMRQAVPAYGDALDTAADPIRRIQATEFGSTILNPQVSREQVATQLAGMGGAERRAAVSGLRSQIDEIAANVRAMASDPNVDARQLREVLTRLSSQAAGDKIAAAVGPAAARRLTAQAAQSSRALQLRASVAVNSRTFGRTATDQQVKSQVEPGVVGLALEGRPVEAGRKAVQSVTQMTPERRLAAEDQLYGEIANALTRVRGRQAEQYLRMLRTALAARSANRQAGVPVGTAVGGALAGATPAPFSGLLQAQP